LPERVCVVSGAASGIGHATVERLLLNGWSVVGVDLGDPAGDLSDSVDWVRGDVTEPDTWRRAVDAAGRRDAAGAAALVSAAADIVVAPFLDTTPADFRRLFEVNVIGTLLGMRALMPAMIERGRGAIAVVCSVDSLYTEEGMSAYVSSKAALLQIVRSAALEHSADGLRVNAVCPGAVETTLFRRALEATGDADRARQDAVRRIPAGVVLKPEEVAEVLCFLVSDSASGLSGAAVTVDGGLTTTYDYAGRPPA
jgi:NAD(P)-dependent dehydrogenase (short-subunit alcohol dehydrogenase family)